MKRSTLLAASLAALLFTALPPATAQADVAVSFSFFHSNLAPYGNWVTAGSYGRVWYPAGVPAGWQPYTVGHWGWGDYGWTWVSADPWGDWTYRYGTWTFQPPWGWVWVPGYTWAPAWVTWSYTNDYVGWAPIPPTFSFSVGGYFGSPVVVSRSAYCFVPRKSFATHYNVYDARVPVYQNQAILARSQNVTRFPVSGGVVRNEGLALRSVERASAARVQRVSAREMRAAPARIEATRTSGRRIEVASPASTKKQASVERNQVERNQVERSRVQTDRRARAETEARPRQEKATRPSTTNRKREPAPASEWRRDEPRKPSTREREVSRPSEPQARKSRPAESSARRPARPAQPKAETLPSTSRASAPRASAPRASAPEKATKAPERKQKRKPRPDSTEKERGRP